MSNIAISELDTTATTLNNSDLILVSKNDGTSFTSAKMTGEKLKNAVKSSIISTDLPIASTTSRGTVKVGTGLTIDSSDGTLNATGTSVTIDNTMSSTSTNPVQNKVITAALNGKAGSSKATESSDGLMSAADKAKLDGIETGAQVNQNTFSNVKVGDTTISSNSKTDTLTLVAGSNVTLTPDSTNKKITVSASGGSGSETEVLKKVYPIGSIYLSMVSTNPSTLFGFGTWERIASGKCLWGSNSSGSDTGTSKDAGLPKPSISVSGTISYSGSHTHNESTDELHTLGTAYKSSVFAVIQQETQQIYSGNVATLTHSHTIEENGSHNHTFTGTSSVSSDTIYGKSDTVQPPALVVNMWKRTA